MLFDHKFLVCFLYMSQIVIAMFNVSCGAGSTASGIQSNPNVVPSLSQSSSSIHTANSPLPRMSPSPTQNQQPSLMRDVDFKNFIYLWYPSYLKPPYNDHQVRLQDGKFEIDEDEQKGIKNLILELHDVSYADLIGNGKEEAIVTISGISIFNRFVGCVFIYALEKGKTKLLWQHETGDRADGGLRRIQIENRSFLIEEYTRSIGDGGLCCPKKFVRAYFEWNGKQFRKIKSEILPNEYDYARFLGYPDDSQ